MAPNETVSIANGQHKLVTSTTFYYLSCLAQILRESGPKTFALPNIAFSKMSWNCFRDPEAHSESPHKHLR